MSENRGNQNNTQGNDPKLNFNPLAGRNDELTQAMYDLIDALEDATGSTNRSSRGGSRRARPINEYSQSTVSDNSKWKFSRGSRDFRRSSKGLVSDVEDGFRDTLLDAISGGDFKAGLNGALSEFTKRFGFELRELPYRYGKYLGEQFSKSGLGKAITKKLETTVSNFLNNSLGSGNGTAIMKALKSGGGKSGAETAGGAISSAEATKLFSDISKMIPWAAVVAALVVSLQPLVEGLAKFLSAWGSAFTRNEDIRRKRLENAQKRMIADMEYLAKEPFNILIKAAEEWENTWDANLSKIALTQGYDKESVYALYSSIAEHLDKEGLGASIPATDVVNNLSRILDAGLSGVAAQAFAYEVTKLNAAVPTQDFTGYASTYAQLATEAMNAGQSLEDAVAYANSQLELFASGLLTASRNLTGGFTTGLQNAQSLFDSAAEIAQTAKTYNVAELSSTLASVSAVIGSVAPDLAQGLVNNIVDAAIGGNSDAIVALRSLAGINAGNSDFLREFANDPQGVFIKIFRSLSNLQNMSPANYMEVAEGLSSVFGVDMKALARVNFSDLANKITNMEVSLDSLGENMSLLQSGEATLSADQLRYQEINNDILENGLAYVIDSEYGRMIQQHMWDEQIANTMQENEYSVNLQGAALELLEGLRHTVSNILGFLNPLNYVADGIARIVATDEQRKGDQETVARILEKTAVGSNSRSFYNLTDTSGKDLGLVTSLYEMLDSEGAAELRSKYNKNSPIGNGFRDFFTDLGYALNPVLWSAASVQGMWGTDNPILTSKDWNTAWDTGYRDLFGGSFTDRVAQTAFGTANTVRSWYSGFNIGKEALGYLDTPVSTRVVGSPLTNNANATALAANKANLQRYLDSMANSAGTMGLAEFKASSRQFGINPADLESALEEFNISMTDFEGTFEAYQSGVAGAEEENRKKNIQDFIEENRAFWDYSTGNSGVFQTAMWFPFFGAGQLYETRMNAVDIALSDLQARVGSNENHTVISGLEEISNKIGNTEIDTVMSVLIDVRGLLTEAFVNSDYRRCLSDWSAYIASKESYSAGLNRSEEWSAMVNAEQNQQAQASLALAKALDIFTADELNKLDPQLQTNVLLGQIVVILQTIMQQNNTQAGGLSLIDTLSALGLGMTAKTE